MSFEESIMKFCRNVIIFKKILGKVKILWAEGGRFKKPEDDCCDLARFDSNS